MKNPKSDLQPNTEDLFIKLTLCFKRDLNRLGLDEPMALALEENLLNMSSLRLHDLLYRLCLLWWHDLVLCSLQELYSCQTTHDADMYASSTHQERSADILRVIDGATFRIHFRDLLYCTPHQFVHIAQLKLMRSRFR